VSSGPKFNSRSYLAHLWIGTFVVDAGLPRVLVSVFFAALTACRLIATWFAESALVTLALHAAAAGGCLLAAACVGSEPRLVLLLATAGFVDPVATMGVRLKEQADGDDDAKKDAAVQRAWTAFNVGILASYAGAALYPYLGACGMAVFSGAVAAVGAAGHLVYLVAASHETGAAANNRGLVRAELVRILSPCNRRAKGDVDHYTLRVVVLTAMALNFVTSSGWQLAALYYETQLKFPPWVATLVMGLSTGLIAFSSKLTPLMLGTFGPESLLSAIALVALLYLAFVHVTCVPILAAICHAGAEYFVDVGLRASQRLLDVCSAAAGQRLETYLVISRVASILASLVAALVAPNLYFYASAAAPFTLCACVCIMLAAVVMRRPVVRRRGDGVAHRSKDASRRRAARRPPSRTAPSR